MKRIPMAVPALYLFSIMSVIAQPLSNNVAEKIDRLFSQWNENTPGYAVGIVRKDSLVFAKGYGVASLEHRMPITANTRFYIASVSKQFTGYCITLLARQRKLDLDEDIRVYLPWFPDLQKKITARHLLHHTSGIRDHLNMIAIAGLTIDGVLTNDLVIKTLQQQKGLNFNPGERYQYSNSNYVLLAEIVRAVSGRSLRDYADSAIFRPLRMKDTHFHDNPGELVEDRALSYWPGANGTYTNAQQNIYTVGDGGIFTTVTDAARWIENFYHPVAGDAADIASLTVTDRLNSGKVMSYASGISVGSWGGWKMYSHGGALHGYNSFMTVYPELQMGIVILGNVREGNIHQMSDAIASLFIEPKKQNTDDTKVTRNPDKETAADKTILQRYEGDYISDEGYLLNVTWKRDRLHGSGFGQEFETTGKGSGDTYSFPSRNNPLTKFVPGTNGLKEFLLEFPDEILHFVPVDRSATMALQELVGEYYSTELECTYHIVQKGNELFLTHARYPDARLMLIGDSYLTRESWYMKHLRIMKDQNGVTGFEVNSGNVMHLPFMKIR